MSAECPFSFPEGQGSVCFVLCVCVCVCFVCVHEKLYVHWSDTPLLENLPWLLGVLVS